MLNPNHLKIFHSVAKNLSFSKAAEELYTSQSSVSVQIKKLEDAIGIKLFEKLGKRIYLTEAGTILYSYSQKVFSLLKEAYESIDEIKGFGKGSLLIGASTTPGVYLMPSIIGKFINMYPGVVPKLEIANSHTIVDLVSKNMLDLGIIGDEFNYPKELTIKPWYKDELFLIMPKKHPLSGNKLVYLEDLKNETFVLREPGSSTRSIVEDILSKHKFRAKVIMELNSTEAVKQAVVAGLGISIVSRFTVINNPEIACVPVDGIFLERMFNIVYHKGKIFSPSTQKFKTFIETAVLI